MTMTNDNNPKWNYSREIYERIKKYNGRRESLYPLEKLEFYNIFQEIEQWNPGCQTCPDTIKFYVDRVYIRFAEMHDMYTKEDLEKEAEAKRLKEEEENKILEDFENIMKKDKPNKKQTKK